MNIRTRIYSGFVSLILLGGGSAAFSVHALSGVGAQVATLQGLAALSQDLATASDQLNLMRLAETRYRQSPDDATLADIKTTANTVRQQLVAASIADQSPHTTRPPYNELSGSIASHLEMVEKMAAASAAAHVEYVALTDAGMSLTAAGVDASETARGTQDLTLSDTAGRMDAALLLLRTDTWWYLATSDARLIDKFQVDAKRAQTAIDATMFLADDRIMSLIDLIPSRLNDYVAHFSKAFAAQKALDEIIDGQMRTQVEAMRETLSSAATDIRIQFEDDNTLVSVLVIKTSWMQRTVAATLLLIGCAMAWHVARGVVGPVSAMTAAMSQLAGGDLRIAIPALDRRDEISAMAKAVAVFRDGLVRADALMRQQRATQLFLDTVVEHVPAPIFVKAADSLQFVLVNRAAEAFTGLPRQRILGETVTAIMSPDTSASDHDAEALASAGIVVEENERIHTLNGGQRLADVTRVTIPGPDGEPRYLLVMIDDVTDRRQAEQRIAYMAHHDTLTDLPNRVTFKDRLTEATTSSRRDGSLMAVLGLDLDYFKEVNDTLGHAAGDELLREVANRLRCCLRATDTLARIGGDEFAIILRSAVSKRDAEALAARLIETIRCPFEIAGQQVFVGLSVGVAVNSIGLAGSELVKQADLALYEAKQSGRSCFRSFVPEMDARLQTRQTQERDLRAAIGTPQLTLHYQPQMDLESHAIVGCEALMRWNKPGQGAIAPSTFIPLAEEVGLIGPLGDWLLEAACLEAMGWPAHLCIAVNVSPVQLRMPGFLDSVRRALDVSGLDPCRLELEVTEGILLRDTESTLGIFATLRTMGVRLALDDFGTGYSSLSYLQKFRFDKIKIDRSFISGVNERPDAAAIVRSVVQLSDALGMRTVVEGVETAAETATLRALGCTCAQGYYFSRPLDAQGVRTRIMQARSKIPETATS